MAYETNLFAMPDPPPAGELFEPLVPDQGVLIERIVSTGQSTPAGEWHDQHRDEWVALLQGAATLVFEGGRTIDLVPGDALLIRAHERHRVEKTSAEPPCVWLAVHGAFAR
jgi:cupin 2 domain-containing protein